MGFLQPSALVDDSSRLRLKCFLENQKYCSENCVLSTESLFGIRGLLVDRDRK
jgi:SUMO ligase MMS21 Smc5/6 complex component